MSYTYVGVAPDFLESGRPLVNGDTVDTIDPKSADQRLIDAGLLVQDTPDAPAASAKAAPTVTSSTSEEPAADAPRT